jgi:hypothetical protein
MVDDITLVDLRGIRCPEGDNRMDMDGFHGPGPERDWSEEFYFDFYDRERDVCGHMRIAMWPNLHEKEFQFFLLMPDGSVIGGRDRLPYDGQRLEVKGLAFTRTMPQSVWRITMNSNLPRIGGRLEKRSHVEMDLTFTGLNETIASEERLPGRPGAGISHAQQFGGVAGKLSTGVEEFEIDTLGHRDHSWGTCDLGPLTSRLTLTCQFSKDHAFSVTRSSTEGGDADSGFVHASGANRTVSSMAMKTNSGPDGSPKSMEVAVTDASGDVHKAVAMVLKVTKTQMAGARDHTIHKMLVRCSTEGKVGYGMAEFWAMPP